MSVRIPLMIIYNEHEQAESLKRSLLLMDSVRAYIMRAGAATRGRGWSLKATRRMKLQIMNDDMGGNQRKRSGKVLHTKLCLLIETTA